MNLLLDVVRVKARVGYLLELEFENGEHRLFDMSSIMDKKPFIRLKESNAFLAEEKGVRSCNQASMSARTKV